MSNSVGALIKSKIDSRNTKIQEAGKAGEASEEVDFILTDFKIYFEGVRDGLTAAGADGANLADLAVGETQAEIDVRAKREALNRAVQGG